VGTGALSPGVKRLECEADHSLPSSFEVKNKWNYISMTSIGTTLLLTLLARGVKICIGQLLNITLVVRETRIGLSALKFISLFSKQCYGKY
jgi:hypothetical protein